MTEEMISRVKGLILSSVSRGQAPKPEPVVEHWETLLEGEVTTATKTSSYGTTAIGYLDLDYNPLVGFEGKTVRFTVDGVSKEYIVENSTGMLLCGDVPYLGDEDESSFYLHMAGTRAVFYLMPAGKHTVKIEGLVN